MASAAGEFVLVTLMVLAMPLVVVIGAPLAFVALVGTMTYQHLRDRRP